MSADLKIVFEPENETAKQFVTNGLDNFNIAATGLAAYYPVGYFLRDKDGELLGGLHGGVWGDWLHIRILWIAEPARGKGHARALMASAEAYAKKRGCSGAFLDTFSFQARPLYEKLGYSVFGELEDCPTGHRHFFMKKMLA
jgi:GNAT superfamily N-acetyltransferase